MPRALGCLRTTVTSCTAHHCHSIAPGLPCVMNKVTTAAGRDSPGGGLSAGCRERSPWDAIPAGHCSCLFAVASCLTSSLFLEAITSLVGWEQSSPLPSVLQPLYTCGLGRL